ncbi:MAG: glycosyltransferase family 4 protein [Luteibaculum sp.]
MKVLQLTVKPPYPAVDGGCIAIKNFSEMILEGGNSLKILSLATHKHPFQPDQFPPEFYKKTEIEGIYVNTELNLIDAFSSIVTMDSYNISRFYSTDFDSRLEEVLLEEDFDVVQLESLFMTPYISTIRRNSNAAIILRSHNFEHSIWEQIAAREEGRVKRWYLKFLANRLRKYELDIMNSLDGVIAISSSDEKRYKNLKSQVPVIAIPFGINTDEYRISESWNKTPKVFHLGAMDWQPNIDGIQWFLKEVWQKLAQKLPQAELSLAGRCMDVDQFEGFGPSVKLIGEVDDAQNFMHNHDIMVVPLHTGGGIRIKILEGMALGKTIVSTPVGAEGIGAKHGEEIFIAKKPEEFVEIIDGLINNPQEVERVGNNAREFVVEHYSKKTLQAKYMDFAKKLQETERIPWV